MLDYLTEERIEKLKKSMGKKQFEMTFGEYEDCDDDHYNTSHYTAHKNWEV